MQILVYFLVASAFLIIYAGDAKSDQPTLPKKTEWTNQPPPSKLRPGRIRRNPNGQIILDDQPRTIRICPRKSFAEVCSYHDISRALASALPKDTVLFAPGLYHQGAIINVPNITLKGEPGAHLIGVPVEGKAALVVKTDDVVIDGIECSHIAVPDQNGACIRVEPFCGTMTMNLSLCLRLFF